MSHNIPKPDQPDLPTHEDSDIPENEEWRQQSKTHQCIGPIQDVLHRNTGLFILMAAMMCFATMDAAVIKLHKLDPPVTTLQLILVRMAITLLGCIIYMYIAKIPDPLLGPKGVRKWLLGRGSGGFFGLFGIYFSLKYLSLSDATVLTFLAPTTTTIAGAIFLKEKFVLRQAVAGLISLSGVVLIARPTIIFGDSEHSHEPNGVTPSERLLAVGASLIGVSGATLAYISIRAVGSRAHAMHLMVYFSLQCVFISTIGMIVTKTPVVIPTRIEWLALLFMIGIFGFAAQFLLTIGFQRENVGRGTLALYTQIIFASTLEYLIFHTTPSRLSTIGISMILGSAIYIALSKKTDASDGLQSARVRLSDEDPERAALLPKPGTS